MYPVTVDRFALFSIELHVILNNGLSMTFNCVKDCPEEILFLSRLELFQTFTVRFL